MRLSEFIPSDMQGILADWEAFAATQLPGAADMKPLELRDHAQKILEAVAKDISQPQTQDEQTEKSKGLAIPLINAPETAAQTHAVLRARDGFDIAQMTAEYRALRASVLRRWVNACEPAHTDLQDMIRFNEAIDQAIAESVSAFSTQVEQARNFFLGMLGHDMRSPLSAILLSAGYLSKPECRRSHIRRCKAHHKQRQPHAGAAGRFGGFQSYKTRLGYQDHPNCAGFARGVREWIAAIAGRQPSAGDPTRRKRQRAWLLGRKSPATTAR